VKREQINPCTTCPFFNNPEVAKKEHDPVGFCQKDPSEVAIHAPRATLGCSHHPETQRLLAREWGRSLEEGAIDAQIAAGRS
jgi:hypothetical protein